MTELNEVFDMVTKQTEPDLDSWKDQERRQRRMARNRKVGAYVVAAAIGVAALAVFLGTRPGDGATTPAQQPSVVGLGQPSGPFLLNLRTGEMTPLPKDLGGGFSYAASPDASQLAYGSSRGGGCGSTDVATVARIDGTSLRRLRAPQGQIICAPQWSPDGTKLVYQMRNGSSGDDVGNLFVEDIASGRRTQITHLSLTNAWWYFLSPSFSPDGRSVIFQMPTDPSQTTRFDVWSVPASGGEPRRLFKYASMPRYFPDGSRVAFATPEASDFRGTNISIANASARDPRGTVVEADSSILWPSVSPDSTRVAYQDGGSIYVVGVFTGIPAKVAQGNTAEWLDNDTLIVAPS